MSTLFQNNLWKLLPPWFQKVDSYKDVNNKGLLERYLNNIGLELDNNFIDYITNFLDIFDARVTPEKLLVYLSGNLGFMPNLDSDTNTYRRLLAYAIQIYKLKGSRLSFELVFNLLGYNIELIEEIPSKPVLYDSGFLYDDNKLYDEEECAWCSGYYLNISPLVSGGEFTITDELMATIRKVADFLQPINATFMGAQVLGNGIIHYGWVNELTDVKTFADILALQRTTLENVDQSIVCTFENTDPMYWIMAQPTALAAKIKYTSFGIVSGSLSNAGNIGNPGDLFQSKITVPGYVIYYSPYKTAQNQTNLHFLIS